MSDDPQQLRAELEALYPYVEERDRLVAERDRVEEQLQAADTRIAELTYQRDRLRWRLDAFKSRRFVRMAQAVIDALRDPRRLLRLPLEILRILIRPSPRPPEPQPPEVVARRSIADRATTETRSDRELRLRFLAPAPPTARHDLRVGAILDTFSASCFAPECDLIRFRPDNWREVLEQKQPHLLFVESAWQGNDGSWQYQVGSYSYADSVGLPHLSNLVKWCRTRDIPTVFWNKEDPVHFDKFKEAAQLFDVVLTTDADRVDAYRDLPDLRAETVAPLPFAAQPEIHNPICAPIHREEIPVFAGTYYKNRHAERREQLEMLLDAARPLGLQIFDRMHGKESESVGYPDRFQEHISGGLPYAEMVEAYKRYRVFLNTNSVTESPTMFSRRVFELLASGTPVVSTPSNGMEEMLGDVLDVVTNPDEAREAIEALLEGDVHWHHRSRAGIRRVMNHHTYAHRMAQVAQHAGFHVADPGPPDITLLALEDDSPTLFRMLHDLAERGAASEILVGSQSTGTALPHPTVTRLEQPATDEPDRYRELADTAGADWVLIVSGLGTLDPDSLIDLQATPTYMDADVVGRAPDGSTHRYVHEIVPSPALVRRDLVSQHGWSNDPQRCRELLGELVSRGHRIYAADLPDG
ncbi:MAG: glycosyltransferase [Nitriliruptorales bacterium]|nr:glycosyltransferase [Nitriliruptorales bacterium]